MTKHPVFYDRLSPLEAMAGWIYLPLHIFVIPILINVFAYFSVNPIANITLNIVYFGIGVLFLAVFMRSYLRVQFDDLLDNFKACIKTFALAFILYFFVTYFVTQVLSLIILIENNPNDLAVESLADTNLGGILALAVFIAPFIEETLFRGVVFGRLRRKSRIAAYAVSVVLFCIYHIWQYLVFYADPMMLVYAIEYIPAGVALAYAYERSGSIFTPIALHLFINSMAFLVL